MLRMLVNTLQGSVQVVRHSAMNAHVTVANGKIMYLTGR